MTRKCVIRLFLLLLLAAGFPSSAFPAVFVYDGVAVDNEAVQLKAETSGRYFAKGGQLVDFGIDGASIGSVLSGGDGIAYKAFTPRKSGLYAVTARSGKDKDRGIILSLKKGAGVVFIDVEGSLLSSTFSKSRIDRSREALRNIIKKNPVVYLHAGMLGIKEMREWLRKNKFPDSPVMAWDAGSVFTDLNRKGLKIKAVIGGQSVIESAAEFKPTAFSFEDFDNSIRVKDWKEIERRLQ